MIRKHSPKPITPRRDCLEEISLAQIKTFIILIKTIALKFVNKKGKVDNLPFLKRL